MHDATARGFATRLPGDSPFTTQNLTPGQKLQLGPAGAKDAVLKKDGERVLVRSVQQQPDGTFTAEIYGFEPSYGVEFDGMKIGENIRFRDEHVISCDV